jgi:hypothetical protein
MDDAYIQRNRIDTNLKRRQDEKRRIVKEQIEEFKFRKEMDMQREKMVANMEKNKAEKVLTQE